MRRLKNSFNKISDSPALVMTIPLKLSCRMASKAAPLKSFFKKVAPTLSGIPSISVTHLANSSQLHYFSGFVLSFCVHSGSSNYFARAESLHSPNMERFVAMIFTLTFSETTSSSSPRENLRYLSSSSNRSRCYMRSVPAASRAFCSSPRAILI